MPGVAIHSSKVGATARVNDLPHRPKKPDVKTLAIETGTCSDTEAIRPDIHLFVVNLTRGKYDIKVGSRLEWEQEIFIGEISRES